MEFLVDSEESQMNNYLIFKEILQNQKEKEKEKKGGIKIKSF